MKNDANTGGHRPYSFRRRLYQIMYLMMALEIVFLVIYALLSTFSLRRQRFQDLKQTLALYNAQVTENLRSVDYYLMEISNYSSEISITASQDDVTEFYPEIARIQNQLEFNLRSFRTMEGMFIYFPRSDTWTAAGNYDSNRQLFARHLREVIADPQMRADYMSAGSMTWVPVAYDDATYLVKIFDNGNNYIGAWTNLDRMASSLRNLKELQADIVFTDADGNLMPMRSRSVLDQADPEEISRVSGILADKDGQAGNSGLAGSGYRVSKLDGNLYLTIAEKMEVSPLRVSAFIMLRDVDLSVWEYLRTAILVLAVTLILFIILERRLRHILSDTVSMMGKVTDSIAAGHEEERIEEEGIRELEMRSLAHSFNEMVDRIQSLRNNVYEEKIQAKTYQLQALRSQVAPHFLINCLNMMGYLADGTQKNAQIIHEMVVTLSQHLRYTLGTKERVALITEAEYERNYVALSELRFPGCITFEMEISEEAGRAMVFPLILIMFTENTFKYNLVMGETLKLIVKADVENGRLHITHIDSGSGFPEDFLREYAAGRAPGKTDQDGTHIGIQNIANRLRLYYGDSARLVLSNEPGMGAREDIDIPFVEYME